MARPMKNNFRDPAPKLSDLKIELCYQVKKAYWRQGWTQIQAAAFLGTSRACIHNVDRLKVEKLSVNQLFSYLAKIEPEFKIMISF